MYKFRTSTDEILNAAGIEQRNRYICTVDNSPKRTYKLVKGELVESDFVDVYGMIQEAAQGLTPRQLINRAMLTDPASLAIRPEEYNDFSKAPKDLMEAQNLLLKASSMFQSLPLDVRQKYDHNENKFLEAVSTGEFLKSHGEALGLIKRKEIVPPSSAPQAVPEGGKKE